MNELKNFRTRWYRWLGQKCRADKPYWATLLNSNWIGWADNVLDKNDITTMVLPSKYLTTRLDIKYYFKVAISLADTSDLKKLDNLYCTEKICS